LSLFKDIAGRAVLLSRELCFMTVMGYHRDKRHSRDRAKKRDRGSITRPEEMFRSDLLNLSVMKISFFGNNPIDF